LLLGLSAVVPQLQELRPLLLINYLTVVGTVLTPTWFFLGTEQQSTLSRITITARMLAVPLTFLLVRTPADLPFAAAIYSGTPVIVGLACLLTLARSRMLQPAAVTGSELAGAFKDGWPLFLSTASMSLYTSTNTALLGFVAGPVAVGYYSAAERVTGAAQGLLGPINQTMYPRISRLMQESRVEAYAIIRRSMRYVGALSMLLSVLLWVLAPYVVGILYGASYQPAVSVLRWLAPLPFVVGLSNVFGIQTMLPLGMKTTFSRIVLLAGPLNIALLLTLASAFGAKGAAASVLTTELLVTLAMAVSLWRLDVPIFRNPLPA
jgi:O-antigen/teichoic acid export membrane protein